MSGISRNWVWLVLVAIGLRVVAAGLLFHTDIKAIYRDSSYLKEGIVPGYIKGIEEGINLPYPPGIYLLFNSHSIVNGWMFSDYFQTWMKDGGPLQTINHPEIFRDLLVMKLPQLLADMALGGILIMMVERRNRMKIGALWWLNPISIYAIYGVGNFDVIPTLVVMFGLWGWQKKKWYLAYAAIGLAAGFKVWPLLLVPFMLALDERKWWSRGLGILISGAVFVFAIAPILNSVTVLKSVFLSNLTSGLFQAGLNIGGGEELPIYLIGYLGLWLYVMLGNSRISLLSVSAMVLGLLFGLSHFHPQWIVWLLPLVAILIVEGLPGIIVGGMMVGYLGVVWLLDDKFAGLGMLKAVNNAFDTIESPRWWLDHFGVGTKMQGLFHGLLLSSVILLWMHQLQYIKVSSKVHIIRIKWMVVAWLVLGPLIFVAAHLPLVFMGRYVDGFYGTEQSTFVLKPGSLVSQEVMIKNNGWSAIELRVKNIGYRSVAPFEIKIWEGASLIRSVEMPGQTIGDDYNLRINFDRIPDSGNKKYTVAVSSSLSEVGKQYVLPFDRLALGEIIIDGKPMQGSLAYATYFNPGGFFAHVGYSLREIGTKIF